MNFEKVARKFGLRAEKTPTSEFEQTLGKLFTKRGYTAITNLTRTLAAGRGHFDTFDNEKINNLVEKALASPKVLKLSQDQRVVFKTQLETYIRSGEVASTSNEEETPVLHLDETMRVETPENTEIPKS